MNKVLLSGNVGKDPVVTTLRSGSKAAKFTLATSNGKDAFPTWHNIIFWDKQAELCETYVKKGSSLIIEGKIVYRDYENKEGHKVYTTEIIGHFMEFIGSKKDDTPKAKDEWQGKKEVKSMSDVNELPRAEDDPSYDPLA